MSADLRVSARQLRLFAAVWFPLLMGIVGLVLWRRAGLPAGAVALWAVAGGVGIAGAVKPESVRPVFLGTMAATRPIGAIVSTVVLATVYLLVFTPIGIAMRALGYDPMRKRFDRSAPSYWTPHAESDEVGRYFRQS